MFNHRLKFLAILGFFLVNILKKEKKNQILFWWEINDEYLSDDKTLVENHMPDKVIGLKFGDFIDMLCLYFHHPRVVTYKTEASESLLMQY